MRSDCHAIGERAASSSVSARAAWPFYACVHRVSPHMPQNARSHQENCAHVCAVCWTKCTRPVRPTEISLIKEYVISNYTKYSAYFPSGMCPSCSRTLCQYRSGNFRRRLKICTDFYPGHLRITGADKECFCRICKIARIHPHSKQRVDLYKQARFVFDRKRTFEVCSECFAIIHPGKFTNYEG